MEKAKKDLVCRYCRLFEEGGRLGQKNRSNKGVLKTVQIQDITKAV
jgi:hypothetical protein